MPNLPAPLLGKVTAITIASPDLERSLAYYRMLGFPLVMRADWPFRWVQVSDGALLIMLREDPKPYIALTYYDKDAAKTAATLEQKGIAFEQKPKKNDTVPRYLLRSPDGLNISLIGIADGFSQPPGPAMLSMPQEDYFISEKYVNKTCGMYGEFAHPVANLQTSLAFWEKLGFSAISTFTAPYPWAIITDGLAVVGLHQTSHFSYPAITYFAADMAAKIAALKKNGLHDYREDGPSNLILTTPEQQHIFLFGMGAGNAAEEKQISTPVIETERLLLKVVTPDTLTELFTTCTDGYIMSFLGLRDEAELNEERRKWQQGYTTHRMSVRIFLLTDKESGNVVGKASFHNWFAMHLRAELGYAMTDEAMKNKGLMKEAVKAMIPYGFEEMNLNRIEAFVGPDNAASIAIVKGAGLAQEAYLRGHFINNGTIEDSVCFALLRKDWDAMQR